MALMRTLRTALAWLGGALVFLAMLLVLLVLPFVAKPRSWDRIGKPLARLLASCFGMRVSMRNPERLPLGGGLVVVSNHLSVIDGFLLHGHLPFFVRSLDQAQHFSWPLWGWFSKRFGNISLDQSGGGRTAGALKAAGRALKEGTSLLIFPEGHRSRDGEFLEFQRGAFRLVQRNGATLVPVVQAGGWEIVHKGSGGVRPGPVELLVLEPWTPERYEGLEAGEFRDRVRKEMAAAYSAARASLARSSR